VENCNLTANPSVPAEFTALDRVLCPDLNAESGRPRPQWAPI
jgi:hypothetical protein